MLGQIRSIGKSIALALLFGFAFSLISCATHKKMALVDDPDQTESSIPWNKREKWEDSGPMSGLTDRR